MKKRNISRLSFYFILFFIIVLTFVNKYQLRKDRQVAIVKLNEYVIDGLKPVNHDLADDAVLGIDNPNTNYGYLQLEEQEKTVYKQIATAIYRYEDKADIGYSDNLAKVYRAVLMDHPDYFWAEDSYVAWGNADTNYIHSIDLGYNVGKIERAWNQYKIDTIVNQCIADIGEKVSDYEKVKYIYEYVIRNVDYVDDSIQNQNIQSVFLNQESVCAGYAKATQFLLNKLNIFSTYVTGTAQVYERSSLFPNNSFGHAWNLVKIEGDYYYLDTTWGDPVFSQDAFDGEDVSYDYLGITTEELLRSRQLDEMFVMPECISSEYNYYVQEKRYIESFDEKKFINSLDKEIDNGQYEMAYKFSDEHVFDEAYRTLIEDKKVEDSVQYYLRVTGKQNCNYLYIKDDQIYTLKILLE